MKREIKFRLYNPETRKIILSSETPDGQIGVFFQVVDFLDYKGKDYSLMQYTGLKDKEGKDVYEGDVLGSSKDKMLMNWVVSFKDGSFGIQNAVEGEYERNPFFRVDSSTYFIDRVVIGNIHEHPHLLTNP